MIEKRIGYQEGGGVHDPLETIIFLMGKRASPGGLSSAEEKELDRLIEKTGYMSQKKSQGGRIGYNGGGKPNGETRRINQDGIMRVAATRGNREYLTMMLSRYYTPRDLYYKNIKELEQMLQMHITESGGLI